MAAKPAAAAARREERPDPAWTRGACPRCDEELVSRCIYVPGRGYLVLWICWGSEAETPTCDYRRVL